MPPRRKRAKVVYAADADEKVEAAPPAEEEDDDDDGDTGPVDRLSTGSKRSRQDEEEFVSQDLLADEDEDDDEDERADAAERRLAGRIAREDGDAASSAGLIKEIYCENFMCHKKLSIGFGRRINFINGSNGSGKSAILAAMQICLGASAKQTHRGNKLGDLVREGHEGTACVIVKLVNEGTDAFRHDLYGDTIQIRRKFGRKGGGKLELLGEDDVRHSTDRKELRSLLDSLKISVDNPVCVLDQENSKHFIRGKAKDKYKFFLRATEIQDVMTRITRVTDAGNKCISDAEHQRTKLESFARLATQAQHEYEEVMRLQKYDAEIRDLKVLLGWVSVRGAERAKENAEGDVQERLSELKDAQDLQKEHETALETSGDDQVKAIEEEISKGQEDLEACRESTKEAVKALALQEKQVKASQRLEKAQKDVLQGLEKDKGEIRKELEKVRKENAKRQAAHQQNAAGARAAELARNGSECDDELKTRAEALELKQKEARALRGSLAELEEADRSAREKEKDAKAEADDDKRHLQMLENTARNPLAAFGDYQQKLSDEVTKAARTFASKPVGPIGAHVKLKTNGDKRWGAALGEIFGKQLGNWIVTSSADRAKLLTIARKLRCEQRLSIVIQKPRPRHSVRKPPHQTSMLDLLTIDDDACFNALVDMARADVTCVFEDKADAESKGMVSNRGTWAHAPGVETLVLRDGSITGAKKGNLFVKRASAKKGVAIGVDASKDAPAAKKAFQASSAKQKDAQARAKKCRLAFDKAQKDDSRAVTAVDQARRAHTTAERNAREAKAKHREVQDKADEAVVLDDTTALEDDLGDMDRELRNAKETLAQKAADVKVEKDKMKPFEKARADLVKRNDKLDRDQHSKEQEMTRALDGQKKLKKRLEKAKLACADLQKKVEQREKLVEEEAKRLAVVVDKARRFTKKLLGDDEGSIYRPPDADIKRFKNEDGVLAKINHTEKLKETQLEKRGGKETDPAVAKAKMERAQLAYAEKEAGCKQIEEEGIQLRSDAHARYVRLGKIRKHICRMSNREFDKILQKKGSSGALRFDHDDATLKMTYQKDNQDESTQIDNIQSLSGGERSFSTLAMLVSLGATIECPFRVMDEFDVFMDQVSRKVAMQELVDIARGMANRQFIFITPQDLSSLPQSDILRVFKLNPPLRGQQTLDGFVSGWKKARTQVEEEE